MKRFVGIILFVIILGGCADDFKDYGYVNIRIEPDSTEFYNLNLGSRGWEYFKGGYRGVIVFRNSLNDFMAYESSCTARDCHGRLEVDTVTNIIIDCPKCGSRFIGYDGSPLSGSNAKRFLYSYCASFDGMYLRVRSCR